MAHGSYEDVHVFLHEFAIFIDFFTFPKSQFFHIELTQVFVKVDDRVSLTADGIDTQSKTVTGGGKSQFGAPLYIGGLPSDHSAAEVNTVLQTLQLICLQSASSVVEVTELKLSPWPEKLNAVSFTHRCWIRSFLFN